MKTLSVTVVSCVAIMMVGHAYAEDFDPNQVDLIDAINCHIDAPTYNGFAISIEGEESIATKRHWQKIDSANPFMNEYELPEPIAVTGSYSTRRIAFTSSGVLAILDLADPAVIGREEDIVNAMDPDPMIEAIVASGKASRAEVEAEIKFRKFLGERVMVDVTEPAADEESFGTHTVISRNLSNATTHPGKTFYGCSYKIELLDRDGKPL